MKKSILSAVLVALLLASCSKDRVIMDSMNEYNLAMETKGYHFGDEIKFPAEVTENAESISISFGDKETAVLKIDPAFFTLGDNAVTVLVRTKSGENLAIDAIINVFAKNKEKEMGYELVTEYPHNKDNFVQGFQLEGNTIYGSNGQLGESKILKYTLGLTENIQETKLDDEYFGEGSTIVGNKIYQLTWQHKKGFIYDKNTLKPIGEFTYPSKIVEGWGLTYDGKHLIISDGTKNIYFVSPENPQNILKTISVAGGTEIYDRINELEYHNGFIYANVWQKPYVLKIDPQTGEVVGKLDFSEFYKKHTTNEDDVLNGIAFKGENMLVTGKNWDKIYEVKIK